MGVRKSRKRRSSVTQDAKASDGKKPRQNPSPSVRDESNNSQERRRSSRAASVKDTAKTPESGKEEEEKTKKAKKPESGKEENEKTMKDKKIKRKSKKETNNANPDLETT